MSETLGRYEITEAIGEGGFAIVYKGHDTALDRPVALKELRPLLLKDKMWVRRFEREAKTIARLDHPHIIPIFDVYETDSRLFIVMRLVDSNSLEDYITRHGKLPWPETLQLMLPLISGLAYAHGNGVLHRDLKPANILLDSERGPLLSDFGLAKLVGEHSLSMTESGSIVGTPHYIAPEVWEGKPTSQQSDIYAMGCILCEAITGEKTFKGETPPAVMMAHFKPLALPDTWPPGVPAAVTPILQTALAQDPADRYTSIVEMGEALKKLADNSTIANYPLPPPNSTDHPAKISSPLPIPPGVKSPVSAPPPAEHTPTSTGAEPTPLAAAPDAAAPKSHAKRAGCWMKGMMIGVGLILVVLIGLGSFCAAAGIQLGNNIDAPISALTTLVSNGVQISDVVSETINIPVPEGDGTPRLEIEVAADKFILNGGAENSLLEGTVSYNVELLKPKVITNGRNIRVGHEGSASDIFLLVVYDFFRTDIQNTWDLKLGNTPVSLAMSIGTAEGVIELNPVSLTDLSVVQGAAGSLDLSFPEANQTEMETFQYAAGPVRRVTLTGLANTHAERMTVTGSGGEYILDFTGDLQKNLEVTLSGDLSSLSILVPAGTAATVQVNTGSTVDASDEWQTDQTTKYFLPGDGPQITITQNANVSTVKLRAE